MNRIAVVALFALLIAAPFAGADEKGRREGSRECVIDVAEWGSPITAPGTAFSLIESGEKPLVDIITVDSDAGFFGPAFILFELPHFKGPVLFGKLRIEVQSASDGLPEELGRPELKIALYDVIDIPLLLQPLWTVEEWATTKDDLASGREYGNFSVRRSPADDGRMLEVPLSYDAMFDINAAAGGAFAIGIANGAGWTGEGERVSFRDPSEGGVVQLVVTPIGVRGRRDKHIDCSKFDKRRKD